MKMLVLERWSKFDSDSPSEVIGIFESEELAKAAIEKDKLVPRFVTFDYEYNNFEINVLKED